MLRIVLLVSYLRTFFNSGHKYYLLWFLLGNVGDNNIIAFFSITITELPPALFFFFQIVLANLGPFYFCMNIRISFSTPM